LAGINWDNMTFRMYPDLIVEETLPNYESTYAVEVIKQELTKREPNMRLCAVLLNGDKYNEIPL